jgi:hypothetical protein
VQGLGLGPPATSSRQQVQATLCSSLEPTETMLPMLPRTMAVEDEKDRLVSAVNNMAMSQPPLVFADRFLFTTDIIEGGQGVVVFARNRDAGLRQFAVKCDACLLKTSARKCDPWTLLTGPCASAHAAQTTSGLPCHMLS